MLALLFKTQAKKIFRYFSHRKLARAITLFLFLTVFLAVAVGIYLFFREGFYYLNHDPFFKQVMILYLYEVFFVMIMLIIIFNAVILGLFGLFRGGEDNWLISSPAYQTFPHYIFLNTCLNSAWPLIIMVLPILLAVRTVYQINFFSLLMIFLATILLIFLIVSLAFFSLIWLGAILNKFLVKFNFKKLLSVIILLLIALVWLIWQTSINTDLIKLFSVQDLSITSQEIEQMITRQFNLLPSHLVAANIFNWQYQRFSQAWLEFIILLAITAAAFAIYWFSSPLFLRLWQKLQEGNFYAQTQSHLKRFKKISFYHFRGGQINTLFKKELLVLQRNVKSLLWFSFLLLIWLMQTGINIVLGRNIAGYQLHLNSWPAIIQVLQFITAVYFICAFVLRFVFPAFSSERKTGWILASAPIDWSKIFWAKYSFYLLIFTSLGLLIGYANLFILGLPIIVLGLSLLLFIVTIIFIITLGLAMGAIFPNFETDDPAILSTTLPGLAFIFLSLIYGAVGGWLLLQVLNGSSHWLLTNFELVSLLIVILLLIRAPQALKNRDLVKIIS